MQRREVSLLKEGAVVIPLIGPFKNQPCTVKSVSMDTGAYNGWITVLLPNGSDGLFAGEEVYQQ